MREFPTTVNHARPDAKTRNHRLLGPPAWRQGSGSGGDGRLAGISAAAGIVDATGAIDSCFTTAAPAGIATCAITAGGPETLRFTEAAGLAEEVGSAGTVTPADYTGSTDIADATGLALVAGHAMVADAAAVVAAAAISFAAATGAAEGIATSCNREETGDIAGAESLAVAADATAARLQPRGVTGAVEGIATACVCATEAAQEIATSC